MPKRGSDKNLARRIGNQIRRLRIQRGLTQFELAEQAGIGISYISKIEQGNRFPSIKTSLLISKALKVELSELFHFKGKLSEKNQPSKEYLELSAILDHLSNDELKLLLDLARRLQNKF